MEKIPYLAESFGQTLRSYREQAGFTRQSLATKSGVSASHIEYLERGKKIPSLTVCYLLCDALCADVYEFLSDHRRRLAQMQDVGEC